jgi:hypothetical protein
MCDMSKALFDKKIEKDQIWQLLKTWSQGNTIVSLMHHSQADNSVLISRQSVKIINE